MTSLSLPTRRRLLRQRISAAVAVCAYLAAAIGFPLPSIPSLRKDTSKPYPCMDHECGCQSAEECWAHCCCFTPEERWAWAEAHNVQPPEYAERPTAQESLSATACCDSEPEERGACCSAHHHETASCCQHHDTASERRACCSAEDAKAATDAKPASDQTIGVRWVLGMSAQRCRGLTMLWVNSGAVSEPPAALSRAPIPTLSERLASLTRSPFRISLRPPSPPPRSFFA